MFKMRRSRVDNSKSFRAQLPPGCDMDRRGSVYVPSEQSLTFQHLVKAEEFCTNVKTGNSKKQGNLFD